MIYVSVLHRLQCVLFQEHSVVYSSFIAKIWQSPGPVTEPILPGYEFQLNNLETHFLLAATKKKKTLVHCGRLQSTKSAFLLLSVYNHGGGWRANQFSLALKKAGARAPAFCSS